MINQEAVETAQWRGHDSRAREGGQIKETFEGTAEPWDEGQGGHEDYSEESHLGARVESDLSRDRELMRKLFLQEDNLSLGQAHSLLDLK